MVHFTKNVALPGGALALMAVQEPWPESVPLRRPGCSSACATSHVWLEPRSPGGMVRDAVQ
jgi:hypothetical protein